MVISGFFQNHITSLFTYLLLHSALARSVVLFSNFVSVSSQIPSDDSVHFHQIYTAPSAPDSFSFIFRIFFHKPFSIFLFLEIFLVDFQIPFHSSPVFLLVLSQILAHSPSDSIFYVSLIFTHFVFA